MADRVGKLMEDSLSLYKRYNVDTVVVEWPRFFGSSKGRMVADSGDLGKLYLAASAVFCQAITFQADAHFIYVNAWKGQLNKAAVIYHICKRLDISDKVFHSHEWDAVGIGLSFMGHFVGV